MRKLDISMVPPYGINASKFADGARVRIKAKTGEELGVDLSREAADILTVQLIQALAGEAEQAIT
jgi:hypothetical protein